MTKKVKKETLLIIIKPNLKIGQLGTIVNVKSGYARNYLIPNKIATLATNSKIKFFEAKRNDIEKIERINTEKFLLVKDQLERYNSFIIRKRVNENNIIFGKITKKSILDLIKEELNLKLEEVTMELPNIEELGEYKIPIQLNQLITAVIKINIII